MVKLQIEGMTCGGCASSIEKAVKTNKNVKSVQVNLQEKTAIIEGSVNPQELIEQIENLGFEAKVAP